MKTQIKKKSRPMSKAAAIARIDTLGPCYEGLQYMIQSKARTFKGLFNNASVSDQAWLRERVYRILVGKGSMKHHPDPQSECPACQLQNTMDVKTLENHLRKIKLVKE